MDEVNLERIKFTLQGNDVAYIGIQIYLSSLQALLILEQHGSKLDHKPSKRTTKFHCWLSAPIF
jgi:hypothetical protein